MKGYRIHRFIFLLFSVLFTSVLYAQSIKGWVINYNNEPVSYASIFIKELMMGTTANENGLFEIKAPAGIYTCTFQHLSYETLIKKINIPLKENLVIKLVDKVYDLPMVSIGANDEDPAYDMIRKAIGMAPFYINQLSEYTADVYIKGSLKIDKISGLVKTMASKDLKEMEIKEGDKYLQESMNEITYLQGKYKQKVKSILNTFPKAMDIGEIGMANYNIYNSNNQMIVSPVSPEAFSYYNFKYEGFSTEGKYIVSKIKVIPKHKSAMTFEGYIYLSEGYWNVHRFELSNERMGLKIINKQVYGELEDNVWMPISNNMDGTISIIGSNATITYVTSIKYKKYKLNPIPNKKQTSEVLNSGELTASQLKASENSEKIQQQINQLMDKSNISNRDAYKISQLMQKKQKEDNKLLPDSLKRKKSFNLSEYYKIEVDSTARKKDSVYWKNMRPVPLMEDELKSYNERDSLNLQPDSVKHSKSFVKGILLGTDYKIDSSFNIKYGGLINPNFLGYNVVDGWKYKQTVSLRKQFKDSTRLVADFEGGYAFNRKRIFFTSDINYNYYPEKRGYVIVSGGIKSSDFNYNSGLPELDNMLSSLIFRKNYINYFEDRFISLGNRIEVANGLEILSGVSYQSRKHLENTTDISFFYNDCREFRPNIPLQNPYVAMDNTLVNNHDATLFSLSLSYTPQMYYRMYGRNKYYAGSKLPTFSIFWRKGIKNIFNSQSDFDQLEFSVKQHYKLGIFSFFKYNIIAGYFPNNSKMHFRDFKNFSIKEFELLYSSFEQSYNTIKTYMPGTNEWYVTLFAQYKTPYLLLKYLPLLNRSMLEENLYVSYITTPNLKNYAELGYGLTNIWLFGSMGAFVGFDGSEYSNWGFKVVLNLSRF